MHQHRLSFSSLVPLDISQRLWDKHCVPKNKHSIHPMIETTPFQDLIDTDSTKHGPLNEF